MKNLDRLLTRMGEAYQNNLSSGSRFYREIPIGSEAERFGFPELKAQYNGALAILPLKHPVRGMKVRIDGRTFINYAQFDSGIVLPGYVARDSKLPHKSYFPQESMILNFA